MSSAIADPSDSLSCATHSLLTRRLCRGRLRKHLVREERKTCFCTKERDTILKARRADDCGEAFGGGEKEGAEGCEDEPACRPHVASFAQKRTPQSRVCGRERERERDLARSSSRKRTGNEATRVRRGWRGARRPRARARRSWPVRTVSRFACFVFCHTLEKKGLSSCASLSGFWGTIERVLEESHTTTTKNRDASRSLALSQDTSHSP